MERFVPQRRHHLQLVLRGPSLAVPLRVVAHRGLAAVPVASQVRRDNRIPPCQRRGHLVPHHMRLRVPVKQQDRRAAPSPHEVDDRFRGLNPFAMEPLEHGASGLCSVAALVLPAAAAGALLVAPDLSPFGLHGALLVAPCAGAGRRMFGVPVSSCSHLDSSCAECQSFRGGTILSRNPVPESPPSRKDTSLPLRGRVSVGVKSPLPPGEG